MKTQLSGSLPGGDRRGTPGADAGRSSIRTIGGSELSQRAPIGSPEQYYSRPSSSISLFPSLPSSPLSFLNYNTDSTSVTSPNSINSAAVDAVQEPVADNPAPTTGQVRARMTWTREMNDRGCCAGASSRQPCTHHWSSSRANDMDKRDERVHLAHIS
ncbi:hypothetical protein ACJJTC_013087 [Scirpophaga incertulas]